MASRPDLERRWSPRAMQVERRSVGGAVQITGYASVWNKLSVDLGGFRERVAPSAFRGSRNSDVLAFWSHDPALVLGRTGNGTLTLREDAIGLRITIDPPATTVGSDAVALIGRGDIA